jgi:hypothetical protein
MGFLEHDVEKTGETKLYTDEINAVPGESFEIGDSFYAKAQRFAGKFQIEQRGIERVPENERTDKSLVKVGTMVCQDLPVGPMLESLTENSGSPPIWLSAPLPLGHWVQTPTSTTWVSLTRS